MPTLIRVTTGTVTGLLVGRIVWFDTPVIYAVIAVLFLIVGLLLARIWEAA